MNKRCMLAVALLQCGVSSISAHEVETRHGAIKDGIEKSLVEGGYTITYQSASSRDIRSEVLASLDLLSTLPLGSGKLSIYVEGSTTPGADGVSSMLAETNGDAGSALDGNGDGRLQISELHYTWPVSSGYLYTGLIDPTGLLDSSDVANDETRQFIGTGFINNPSIDFPDYTLGVAWHISSDFVQPGLMIFLGSSHGLSDNPDASYAQLFDTGASGKGVFAAAELDLSWHGISIRPGAWVNTADHERFDQSGSNTSNYGIYTSIDGRAGEGQWNLRLGLANKDVSEVSHFAATTLEHPFKDGVLGVGFAHTWVSDQVTNTQSSDMTQTEVYVRFAVLGGFEITPSIQWLHNSGFNTSDTCVDSDTWVGTLRLTWPL